MTVIKKPITITMGAFGMHSQFNFYFTMNELLSPEGELIRLDFTKSKQTTFLNWLEAVILRKDEYY